uniref:Uncharacterized protein n=1 Tax=Alexandrium monilatum TaxID=311494 RepID=A0A7S4RQT2_9DINO|mmetsp:Transcript_34287/g.107097  ORF Transcript_34287/g.107097 Transcript_34287/m.107097 type:complete len:274 (-) Transcript_34287:68-889(-)
MAMPGRAAHRRRVGGGHAARTPALPRVVAAVLGCCLACCLSAAGHNAYAAARAGLSSRGGTPGPASHHAASRRSQLLGIAGALAPPVAGASAAAPVGFDYRKMSDLDPTKRTIVGDVNSAEVQAAVATLRAKQDQAKAAAVALKAEPMANISGNFGLVGKASEGDNILNSFKAGSGLQGSFAGPAEELRAACRAIDGIMDARTRSDTERASRLLISSWYAVVQDPNIKPLDPSVLTGDIKLQLQRQSKEVQAKLQREIAAYVDAIDFLLKFVA